MLVLINRRYNFYYFVHVIDMIGIEVFIDSEVGSSRELGFFLLSCVDNESLIRDWTHGFTAKFLNWRDLTQLSTMVCLTWVSFSKQALQLWIKVLIEDITADSLA